MEQIEVIFYGGTGYQTVGGFADGDTLLPALSVDLRCFNINKSPYSAAFFAIGRYANLG